MKAIDPIVRRLTTFYYIFLAITFVSLAMAAIYGFISFDDNYNRVQTIEPIPNRSLMVAVKALSLVTLVAGMWLLVIFVKMVIAIGVSIKKKDIFNPKPIKLILHFVIVYSITMACVFGVAAFGFTPSEMSPVEMVDQCLSCGVTIVTLMMFREVLKIGNILKTEQELTV